MKCPDCGAEMKPLATSVYCPNDCDRKVQEIIDPEKTEKIIWPASLSDDADYYLPKRQVDQADWTCVDEWLDGLELDTD